MIIFKGHTKTKGAPFAILLVFCLFIASEVSASSVVPVVASGKVACTGTITKQVRRAATENMEINAVKQLLEEISRNVDQTKISDFIKNVVAKNPGAYVENYKILAELRDRKYFQLTGNVNIKKDDLVRDFNGAAGEQPAEEKELSMVLLITEFNPRTKQWEYWWKLPPDNKQKLYFTNQLARELESRGVLVVYRLGKEKILLQSTNFQTPFITTDAAIQLGLIYRTPFVVLGNLHLSDDENGKKFLVASLQVLSTDNGENIAEIIEKEKVRSIPRKSRYIAMAKLVAPRVLDEVKTYVEKSATDGNIANANTTSPATSGEYLITIEISNVNNLRPLEVLQKYFEGGRSPVTSIKSITLEHRKVVMQVTSAVDGTLLARKIMLTFPGEDEFSILSSSEDSIKISSSYSGEL